MNRSIEALSNLSNKEAMMAGGKGASLGEMTRREIPVPKGFVVMASVFENFLEKTGISNEIDLVLSTVKPDKTNTVSSASEKIQQIILEAKIPEDITIAIENEFDKLGSEFVAVRSSATAEDSASAAWAGQLNSFLNTNRETLLLNVSKCWASLFTPRAISYRFKNGLQEKKISVAIVIQEMIDSEVSGIAFSANTVTGNRNQIIIEAGFGLGEAIVSGKISPDSYLIEKKSQCILETIVESQECGMYRAKNGGNEWREIGTKGKEQKLNQAQINELTQLITRTENLYGFPCDIEWAYANNQFYILQCRPITSIKESNNLEEMSIPFLNPQEYIRGWEAHISGVPLTLIADVSASHHRKWQSVSTFNNELRSDLIFKTEVDFYTKLGETTSVDTFEKQANFIITNSKLMSKELETICQKSFLSKTEVSYMFQKVSEILNNYSIFSEAYTDGAMKNIKKDPNSPQSEKLLKILSLKNDLRAMVNATVFYPNAWPGTIVEKLSSQFNIPKEDLWQYREGEVMDLFDGKYLDAQEVAQRKSAFVFYRDKNGKVSIFSGNIAKTLIMQLDDKETNNLSFVKGQTANDNGKGKVIGPVRLIKNTVYDMAATQKYIESVCEGDVIISEATEPDLLPALYKCAAVVTNRGGLLSHAAITAREIGICCIVGAKGATSFFGDGDIVEIDPSTGIIRLLKKSV